MPTPRPSRISIVIARETTSRDARSYVYMQVTAMCICVYVCYSIYLYHCLHEHVRLYVCVIVTSNTKTLALGAYLSMNRSPDELRNIPPDVYK